MTDLEKSELLLKNIIAMENSSCPKEMAEGIECVRVYLDDDNVIYDFKLDEDLYDVSLLKSAKIDTRDILNDLKEDRGSKKEADLMLLLNKGLVYHYYGNKTGKSFDVSIPYDDLKKVLEY